MAEQPLFEQAFPYRDDLLTRPVLDLDAASRWYPRFGMREVERRMEPCPTVILERDGVRLMHDRRAGRARCETSAKGCLP